MRQLQEVRQAWRRGILYYYCSCIGAPQSKDMNASHGRRIELPPFVMIAAKFIVQREGNANNKYFASVFFSQTIHAGNAVSGP
jgi:hypothetical protein